LAYHCRILQLIWMSRAEIVRWVAENKRPFKIVSDRGFKSLMKTGRPDYRLPSPQTVSRDVKHVFANVRKRIAKMLKVCWYTYRDVCESDAPTDRSMTALLISLRMPGPHPIAEHLLQ
jgi:hypothetical protein